MGLSLESPAERLRIPKPFRSSDSGGGGDAPPPDRAGRPLASMDIEKLRSFELRKGTAGADPERVVVRVDGVERLALEARLESRASCELAEAAQLMEVWGVATGAGDTILAVHEPSWETAVRRGIGDLVDRAR